MTRRESNKETATMESISTSASAATPLLPLRLRRAGLALALACTLGACLALAAAPAVAIVFHQQTGSFNGEDAPSGPFTAISMDSAATDSSGDVYVLEANVFGFGHSVVDKFDAKGAYASVQITGAGTPAGSATNGESFAFAHVFGLLGVSGVAVDNTASGPNSGDVYVADTGHHVVDRFSGSTGAFECQITARTPSSKEEEEHECNGASGSEPTGGPAGLEPTGLAVDSAGDLYVANEQENEEAIDEFGPHGEFLRQIANAQTGSHLSAKMGSIALDAAGDIYVTNYESNVVQLSPGGAFSSVVDERSPYAVAVDPSTDHVDVSIVASNEPRTVAIAEYEPSATTPLDTFASASEANTKYPALAIGPTGNVYVGRFAFSFAPTDVMIFSPDIAIPNATTRAATEVGETTATLNGHLDPDAAHGGTEVQACRFEYGPTTAYGDTASCTPGPPYAGAEDVSAAISELRSSSTYHFRVVASNSNGIASYGEDETFQTRGAPTIDHESAEGLTTSVRFLAKINPRGYDTSCQVQYVTDASFQQSRWAGATSASCKPEDIGSGFSDVKVLFKVGGLARATTYHYRILASNQAGLAGYPDRTFETYGVKSYAVEEFKSSQINGGQWSPGEPESSQAGSHPYEIVSSVEFSKTTEFSFCIECNGGNGEETEFTDATVVNTKDIHTELPPGLIGNPQAVPKCDRYRVNAETCPGDTQVGRIELWLDKAIDGRSEENTVNRLAGYSQPLYNVTPSGNSPAEFGAFIEGQAGAWIAFRLRSGGDYGVTADALNIVGLAVPEKIRVRVWGVPADPAHDADRTCFENGHSLVGCASDKPLKPLLRNPTSCTGPQTLMATADTWEEPGGYVQATTEVPGFTDCGKLRFEPSLEAQPTSSVADSPTGLHVDLHVPQDVNKAGFEEPGGLATPDLKDSKMVLPAGLVTDPSAADGLRSCSEAQVGYLRAKSLEVGRAQFTPGPAECPDSAKVGSAEVITPLMDHPLPGAVYVATPWANPFKSLLALYIPLYDAKTGVVIKLYGKVSADPVTGQLTTVFPENPQLPFNDLKVDFFPGSRAALTTPFTCGSYSVHNDFTPWSAPEGKDATPLSAPFVIGSMPGGGACVGGEAAAPNTPGFEAGMASPIAGAYSPFVLRLKREDGSQRFSGLSVTLPPGLIGRIAGLEECPQSGIETAIGHSHEGEGVLELSHPSCPAGSLVGSVHVGAGSGAPDYVAGRAYFAGPYEGAPFSLAIVTPALAGPYDLGAVVVRAGLYIDRNTAQVTVRSDPFPWILDGIPLDIRNIDVDVNRKEFTLNPTSCSVMSITGQESSSTGQSAGLADRFQAGGCTTLPFHPAFSASTSGVTSRKEGASLAVHVASSMGEANIAKVKVTLPKQLPSRLETLKGACPEGVFAANPASCPAGSSVGTAVARTPILNNPLTGPVYIVSHGGAAFPDVEVVLQGEGVMIVLDGKTNIQNGITTSTFETVPDAPVTSFEMSLPKGAHSILSAPGVNLCSFAAGTVLAKKTVTVKVRLHGRVRKRRIMRLLPTRAGSSLLMPTTIQGQNGAVINQNTPIEVTGCATASVKRKTSHARHRKRKARKTIKKHG